MQLGEPLTNLAHRLHVTVWRTSGAQRVAISQPGVCVYSIQPYEASGWGQPLNPDHDSRGGKDRSEAKAERSRPESKIGTRADQPACGKNTCHVP